MRWYLKSVLIRKRHSTHWINQPVLPRYRPVNSWEPEPILIRNWKKKKSVCVQASPFTKVKCELTGTFQAIFVLMTYLIICITQIQELQNILHLFENWGGKDKNSALLIAVKNLSPCASIYLMVKKKILSSPKNKKENSERWVDRY